MKEADSKVQADASRSVPDDNTALLEKLKAFDHRPAEAKDLNTGNDADSAPIHSEARTFRSRVIEKIASFEAAVPFKSIMTFYISGEQPAEYRRWKFPENGLSPAVFQYRDMQKTRYDYPACRIDDADPFEVKSLTTVFDTVLAEQELSGDALELFRRDLIRVEAEIKKIVVARGSVSLSTALELVLKGLQENNHKPKDNTERLAGHHALIKKALPKNVQLLPFDRATIIRLFEDHGEAQWRAVSAPLREEIDTLLNKLDEWLTADNPMHDTTHSAAHLKASLGKSDETDLDLDALSALISESRVRQSLPTPRRQRLERTITRLKSLKTHFFDPGAFQLPKTDQCRAAQQIAAEMRPLWADLWKQVFIARLEAENHYEEAQHDGLFDHFSYEFLSDAERNMSPPVQLVITGESLRDTATGMFLDNLTMDYPVKTLLLVSDLIDLDRHDGPTFDTIGCGAAKMAIPMNGVYISQTPASQLVNLAEGFSRCYAHIGSALISVYIPGESDLPAFLQSAAAAESRVFPAFSVDPTADADCLNRFSLAGTPAPEAIWTDSTFSYESSTKGEISVRTAFTACDFLAGLPSLKNQFLLLPADLWEDRLIPLQQFLQPSAHAKTGVLPFVWVVDTEGFLWKAVPNEKIVQMTRQTQSSWKILQELGGINNSHVQKALADERPRIEGAANEKLTELKAAHAAELSRTVESLTEDIIARIAAGLLQEGVGTAPASPPPLPRQPISRPMPDGATPTVAASEQTPAAAASEQTTEAADDALSFDDPYIDTPLCTSCNDCINKNNRMFAYDENKQAYIADASAGTFRELVETAEKCPVKIIHPGKPKNSDEPNLDELIERAAKFN